MKTGQFATHFGYSLIGLFALVSGLALTCAGARRSNARGDIATSRSHVVPEESGGRLRQDLSGNRPSASAM